nr:MAG TPA: hypothetical protein [Caudoviricetes sp.]
MTTPRAGQPARGKKQTNKPKRPPGRLPGFVPRH